MRKREAYRKMWRAVKAYVTDDGYDSMMDDLLIELSETHWQELLRWLEIADDILESHEVKNGGAAPLPLIRRKLGASLF